MTQFGTSGASATGATASFTVSLWGISKWIGPGGAEVASRIARRICWCTVAAWMVELHFTTGAYRAIWSMRWRRPMA